MDLALLEKNSDGETRTTYYNFQKRRRHIEVIWNDERAKVLGSFDIKNTEPINIKDGKISW